MSVSVPLLDLKNQYASIRDEIEPVVKEVIESQWFIMGPEVKAFEEEAAAYSGAKFGLGVSSGTDALLLALMTAGIGQGDEVITTPYTFFATAGSIARLGATPVFVDIDPVTFNINPELIEEKITSKTKAIMPVHLYGLCADMDPILKLASANGIIVIEDAAQAIGATYKGAQAGSMGDYGCFSFFPSKNLGCFGDGGLITMNDAETAERARILRVHGGEPKYYHSLIGGNFRLDALQAAVLRVKLKHLDNWHEGRRRNASRYEELFVEAQLADRAGAAGSDKSVVLPVQMDGAGIYNQFVVRVKERDTLRTHMQNCGVGTEIYYPVPLHLQECFSYLGHKEGDFEHSERAANETLALPIYPELTDEQLQSVVSSVVSFYS